MIMTPGLLVAALAVTFVIAGARRLLSFVGAILFVVIPAALAALIFGGMLEHFY